MPITSNAGSGAGLQRMHGAHPRLLIVNCQAFNYANGPGITLSNLFRGWPKDGIATVHDDLVPVANDVCERYYPLGEKEANRRGSSVGSYLRRKRAGVLSGTRGPRAKSSFRWASRSLEYIRERANPRDLFLRYEISPELEAWIREFSPDIVYTQPSSVCFMSLAHDIASMTRARLAIHFMDDWPSLFRGPDPILRLRSRNTLRWLGTLQAMAGLRLTIGERMAIEYRKRYGYDYFAFHNPAPPNLRPRSPESLADVRSPAQLVYSGVISSRNQLSALRKIRKAVEALCADGCPIRLCIYTSPRCRALYEECLASHAVRFEPYVEDQQAIHEIYKAADLLVIPLSFEARSLRYTALSMPTKVTSYMASGTPILVVAPGATALGEYAAADGWAHPVARDSSEDIRSAIRRMLATPSLRLALYEKARSAMEKHHDAQVVQQRMHSLLQALVSRR